MRLKTMMVITGFFVCSSGLVFAQETDTASASSTDYKQKIESDKAAIKTEKDTFKENASAARQEEKELFDQIRTAEQSGDHDTAKSLKEQLKTVHQENVEQKKQISRI